MKVGDRVRVTRVADPEYNTRWAMRIGKVGRIVRESWKGGWVVDFEDGSEDQWMEFKEDELEVAEW